MLALIASILIACPPWCAEPVAKPCDCADTNGDTFVDLRDLEAVVYLVHHQNLAGDLNCDGSIDPDDIADWIVAYFECTT